MKYYWHILRPDMKLGFDDERIAKIGETLTVDPDKLELCNYGLHASEKLLDALSFCRWNKPVICKVMLGGTIIQGDDKVVASERTIVNCITDADTILIKFAIAAAEDVLHFFEQKYPDDDRPRKAIEMAKDVCASSYASARASSYASARAYADGYTAAASAAAAAAGAAYARAAYVAAAAAATYVASSSYAAAADAKNKYNTWLTKMVEEEMSKNTN